MTLLGKVRTLIGALAHKPFMSRPDKLVLEKGGDQPEPELTPGGSTELETQETAAPDRERVADLIAQRHREKAS